jgi:hypothetical protein
MKESQPGLNSSSDISYESLQDIDENVPVSAQQPPCKKPLQENSQNTAKKSATQKKLSLKEQYLREKEKIYQSMG